jgi:hypothetical protein
MEGNVISLQRLVELRTDEALVDRLKNTCERATELVAVDIVQISKRIAAGRAVPSLVTDAQDGALAMMLAIHEESRRPYIEFLQELDKSAVVRVRPHLHEKLKELLK